MRAVGKKISSQEKISSIGWIRLLETRANYMSSIKEICYRKCLFQGEKRKMITFNLLGNDLYYFYLHSPLII